MAHKNGSFIARLDPTLEADTKLIASDDNVSTGHVISRALALYLNTHLPDRNHHVSTRKYTKVSEPKSHYVLNSQEK